LLKFENVHASYGAVLVLQGVTLEVAEGEVVALLGANGAGKTTTLRTISGLLRPSSGLVEFEGRRIDRAAPERIVQMGISQVPEGRQTFTEMTVIENLRLGAYTRRDSGAVKQDLERVYSYFPVLEERQKQQAGLLSGGEQQMLAIGRALMARPRLLLLDEPSLGLAPILVREIFEIIGKINREEGLAILVVEQDANLALGIAAHGYVLETGKISLHDTAANLKKSDSIRRAYLE
jgi:branched-chain amino acid transport system ATP-binding protein